MVRCARRELILISGVSAFWIAFALFYNNAEIQNQLLRKVSKSKSPEAVIVFPDAHDVSTTTTEPATTSTSDNTATATNANMNNDELKKKKEKPLVELFKESGTDKWFRHHYEKYYEKWLAPYRDAEKVRFLEIGADQGKSLNTWVDYFHDEELVMGLAYGKAANGVEEKVNSKVQVTRGDQGSMQTLDMLVDSGPYDIILDDGSHYPPHMVMGFAKLFKDALKPGGLYIIEDLETNYWDMPNAEIYGYFLNGAGIGTSPSFNAVEKFKQLIDRLMFPILGQGEKHILPGDDQICSITFGMNLVSFYKCAPSDTISGPGWGPKKNRVNITRLDAYLEEARSTNPDGFVDATDLTTTNKQLPAVAFAHHPKTEEVSVVELFKKTGTDKEHLHHYEKYYEKWLEPFRHKENLRMLEIGADQGLSLNAWADYFSGEELIMGLAYGGGASGVEEKISEKVTIVRGDQGNVEVLDQLLKHGPFDIIIDDGSHYPPHMMLGLAKLFKDGLKPGGLYIIEDLETNYWDNEGAFVYGYTINVHGIGSSPASNAMEKFKQLIEPLMFRILGQAGKNIYPGDDQICSITFGMNILAFYKCNESDTMSQPGVGKRLVNSTNIDAYVEKARSTNPEGFRTYPFV